ncbi:hypothetical protein Tco_1168883, partial [Tanacetum coccineum]
MKLPYDAWSEKLALEEASTFSLSKKLRPKRGDDVAGIKRRRRDLSNDGVRYLVTASGRGRLKEDLESST